MKTSLYLTIICRVCLGCLPLCSVAQANFQVQFDTLSVPGLPGLHSFVFAQHGSKWLLLGGRKDGLHPKNGGFQTSSANQQIYVVEPLTGQVWQRGLAGLPDTLQEQLRSTNMEFFQQGETLCFVGGYGRSETVQDHITYPYLTLINVPGLMDAVETSDSLAPHFQQVRDTFFAVTGGQLQMLGDTFYLVGGHCFEGVYSANSGANNIQFYTNAIRKFMLEYGGAGWHVGHKSQVVDELNLHRRDYNLVPQIFENGESGISAFSGVFQPGQALLPFLNTVEIRPSGHTPVNGFSQFLANYHCAKVPLFEQSQVPLVLAGHDHNYQRIQFNGITYLVSGGGSSVLYGLAGTVPDGQYFARRSHFVILELDGPRIRISAMDEEGEVFDRAVIEPQG